MQGPADGGNGQFQVRFGLVSAPDRQGHPLTGKIGP
jgi:hypothetical protein